MIAIYHQSKKEIINVNNISIDEEGKFFLYAGEDLESAYIVAEYDTKPQAQYALDQIALAIERGDKLFRMPSAEEVEFELTHDCKECANQFKPYETDMPMLTGNLSYCDTCKEKSYWQPKE